MLLAVNVGNTNTVLGVFAGAELKWSWRMSTQSERTADELAVVFGGFLEQHELSFSRQITGVAIASVVPTSTRALREMTERYFSFPAVVVEPGTRTGLSILTDNPREVGADRIVNALAAYHRYGGPCIVIDFGTATTFNCVNDRGEFIGGAIAPGIATSVEALVNRAARLARVELARPKEAIGRNTTTNLQSGAIYGYAGLVDGLIGRMRAEMGGTAQVIATGGNAGLVVDVARCVERIDEHLRLQGLRMLYEEAHPLDPQR